MLKLHKSFQNLAGLLALQYQHMTSMACDISINRNCYVQVVLLKNLQHL